MKNVCRNIKCVDVSEEEMAEAWGFWPRKIGCCKLEGPERQGHGLRLYGNETYVWNGQGEGNIPGTGNTKYKGLDALLICSKNDKKAFQLSVISRRSLGTSSYELSLRNLA